MQNIGSFVSNNYGGDILFRISKLCILGNVSGGVFAVSGLSPVSKECPVALNPEFQGHLLYG